jgi:type IV secretory pathway TrbD component
MSSVTASRPVHKAWLVFTARTVVMLQALAIIFLLTSIWTTLAIAVLFVVTVSVVRALARASQQIDTIFDEDRS